jgi:hypothetical protein
VTRNTEHDVPGVQDRTHAFEVLIDEDAHQLDLEGELFEFGGVLLAHVDDLSRSGR